MALVSDFTNELVSRLPFSSSFFSSLLAKGARGARLTRPTDNVSENVHGTSVHQWLGNFARGKKVAKAPLLSLRLPLLGNHRAKFRNRIS